jgi:hypothetical protein
VCQKAAKVTNNEYFLQLTKLEKNLTLSSQQFEF